MKLCAVYVCLLPPQAANSGVGSENDCIAFGIGHAKLGRKPEEKKKEEKHCNEACIAQLYFHYCTSKHIFIIKEKHLKSID